MSQQHPLEPVVNTWLRVIESAREAKAKRFGADAAECMRFLTGPYDFFWQQMKTDRHFRRDGEGGVGEQMPDINVQTNKTAEFVQLFGPSLYAKNPIRRVTPRETPDLPPELYAMTGPQAQMIFQQSMAQEQMTRTTDAGRAAILECYLGVTPNMLDLRGNARQVIDEALIKGMGLFWPEPYRPAGAKFQMVGSFHGTVDDLFIDPDCRRRKEAKWVSRRCTKPTWELEREFGLPPGSLANRARFESRAQAAAVDTQRDAGSHAREHGQSNDLIVYYHVWSKMGCGGKLSGMDNELSLLLEGFPLFSHLVVAEGVPYPLNVPPDVIGNPQGAPIAKERMQWETPYWADGCGGWPFYEVAFHEVPNDPWPLAHLAPAMGEMKMLNWFFSHIASKIRTTSRDFIACLKSAGEEIKAKILHGHDLSLIEVSEAHGKSIDQIVQFLKHPEFNGDIWKVAEAIMGEFEKRTGLTELMYGESGKQMRSGTEAQLRGDKINIRPDDMAECVEDAMSRGARMEALAARWHLKPDDVRPVLGPVGAMWWEQLVHAADPREILFNLTYRVEAGSAKKPNKARDQEQANNLMNNLFQPFLNWGSSTGDMKPVNALVRKWLKAQDEPNPNDFLFVPPPAPMQSPGATPPAKPGPANTGAAA